MAKYPPLAFAEAVSDQANSAWADGTFLENVTPTTKSLLTYWFDPAYTDLRPINFHKGQRQAILNIIYLYEVLHTSTVLEACDAIAPQLLSEKGSGMESITGPTSTYNCPKYCVKMATGTGKTWVLEALVVWQYLNARHEDSERYTKNFLIVAPGLIVYDRLLDAFRGRNEDNGDTRDFETCDLKQNQDLFIPDEYREEMFGFLQGSVVEKTGIGSTVTGDGIVAITNFHLLMGVDDAKESGESWSLPVSPGTSAGHGLDDLDRSLGDKRELEFLRNLPGLMVINDEAHHIHEVKKHGETGEVEWQKSLRYIAEPKGIRYLQLDFSATPYNQRGKEKVYFLHIVVDFELKTAIQTGLVKTVVLDERKELNTEALDYKVLRDDKKDIIDLSDGQRQMLRAGLAKLNILEQSFATVDPDKVPKMLIMCEDTEVVPYVRDFLLSEGRDTDDILEIHSNKRGEVGQDEWEDMKQQLFALDRHKKPRIVISVLMLREGFDVNNICVIVPLRSTTSGILLEQTIGRGLRLMWRGNPEIDELKRENRHRILEEKKTATNYFDVLSIVEHPAFREFYQSLIEEGVIGIDEGEDDPDDEGKVKGDLLKVGLKPDYEQYDFRIPTIIQEATEIMKSPNLDVNLLKAYHIPLSELQKFVPDNEKWISTEVTENTHFGDFDVTSGVFQASSYNDYLMRIVNRIINKLGTPVDAVSKHRRGNDLPAIAVGSNDVARLTDKYIRNKLFGQGVNPQLPEVWKVLRLEQIINHISSQISMLILEAQEQTEVDNEAEVVFNAMSSVDRIMVRENYAIEPVKCIYEKLPYPSNKGLYEKDFCEFADNDGEVDAFCKVIERKHTFLRFRYVREDGLPSNYIPDFLVRFGDDIYLVETKAQDQLSAENVKRKQRSACNWVDRINKLPADKREGKTWHYAILGDETFNGWRNKRATLRDMLNYAELRNDSIISSGRLFN